MANLIPPQFKSQEDYRLYFIEEVENGRIPRDPEGSKEKRGRFNAYKQPGIKQKHLSLLQEAEKVDDIAVSRTSRPEPTQLNMFNDASPTRSRLPRPQAMEEEPAVNAVNPNQQSFSFGSTAEDFRSDAEVQKDLLTKIFNTLFDISKNVSAIVDNLPDLKGEATPKVDTLKQEELSRESREGGVKKAAFGVLSTAPSSIFGAFEKILAILTPILIGFALAFVDLTDPIDLVKKALIGFAAFIAGKFIFQLIKSVTSAIFVEALKRVVFGKPTIGRGGGGSQIPGGAGGGAGGGGGVAGGVPNAPAPVDQNQRFGFLVKLANGIRDLGAGIGAAIASFFQGFATGLAAFGAPGVARGIVNLLFLTAGVGAIAYLMKLGDVKWENMLMAGAGLTALALGITALGNPLAIKAMQALANPATAKGILFLAAAIGVIGVAMLAGAFAFKLFGEGLKLAAEGTEKTVSNLSKLTEIDADALYEIGPAIMSVAAGLAAFTAAMAIGTFADLGTSIARLFGAESPMEKVIRFAKEAKEAGLVEAAKSIDTLASSLQKLNSLQLNNLGKIGEGLSSLSVGVGKFSEQNVIKGISGFISNFLNKTPADQIVKLSKESSGIYEAGIGVKTLGEGLVAFNSVDPKKVSETIKQVTSITEEQLKVLSKFVVVGTQIQQAQTLQRERNEVDDKKTARETPQPEQTSSVISVARGGDSFNTANYYGPPLQAEPSAAGLGYRFA